MNTKSRTRIVRFSPLQRLFHLVLMLTFLTQAATGLARLYIETSWGRGLAWIFGGYESCRTIHVYVGIRMIGAFLAHLLYLIFKVDWGKLPRSLAGPDSLLPRMRDVRDFFQHLGWFLGLAKAPRFDRWGYWEKFDYWAVFWGMVIMGVSGLILAYPMASSRFMPGWGLNVAFWIHRIEAILAMGHVFIIHFFIAHLRPANFPMDRAMIEGSADLAAAHHERPAWVARLRESGDFENILIPEAAMGRRILIYVIGFAAVVCGVFLLIGGLVNSPYITW